MISYYHCIVKVDIPDGEMPYGSDLPLRRAVSRAAEDLHPSSVLIACWSGWGLSEKGAKRIMAEGNKQENMITMEEVDKRDGPQQLHE